MRKAMSLAAVITLAVLLGGCPGKEINFSQPCGVITDPLKDVQATTRGGNQRLASHFERGVSAKCWQR
jgi:hypothetical protein